MAKKLVAIALAVWLTWASFVALTATALPDKTVAGGVLGPGGNPFDASNNNPANYGTVAFYLQSNPARPVLQGADSYNRATGTEPANFARNVGTSGSGWDWVAGDTVIAVIETTRGVNGWPATSTNYTTSIDAVMNFTDPQDIGNGVIEAFPTVSMTTGSDWAALSWPRVTDANNNVVSYELFTAATWAGPWTGPGATVVARVLQGANPAYNHTGLSAGPRCWAIGVNYRPDAGAAGLVYTTVGRSEVVCTTLTGASPQITSTNPASGQSSVAVNAPIIVTFSESIQAASLLWTINPNIPLVPGWNAAFDTLTFTHGTDFATCTDYTVTITQARDNDGNNLIPGSVPNPWTFTTICNNPYLQSTNPLNGATQVGRTANLVITFSKAMNQASVTVQAVPVLGGAVISFTNAWAGNTVTASHATAFLGGTQYRAWVNGTDTTGNALTFPPGVSNPFDFTTNTPPTATLTAPGVGECHSGGFPLVITWTMDDPDGAETALHVYLNYTIQPAGPTNAIVDQTGWTPPYSFSWSVPATIDDAIQISLEVRDVPWDSAQDTSPDVTIDSTAPTVSSIAPAGGATNVATNANIVITFSEAMNPTATQAAFQIVPDVTGKSFQWANGDTTLTVLHTGLFTAGQPYTVSFDDPADTARDACNPGIPLPSFSSTFTAGAGTKRPNAPTNVRTSSTASAITVSWDAPTTYTPDNTPIPAGAIINYLVFRGTGPTFADATQITMVSGTASSYADASAAAGTTYNYWIVARDGTFGDSAEGGPASGALQAPPGGEFPWLLVLIPLIVILVLVGLFLLMRRRKPAAAPPKPAKAPPTEEAPPAEEAAPAPVTEETAPAEEGGEKYIPCPNCGTMVKPTDAECFVCGAKL